MTREPSPCHTEYIYNGSQLTQMKKDGATLSFTYDASGMPVSFNCNGATYYYTTNIQGDVVSILRKTATGFAVVGTYVYNAWGYCTITGNASLLMLNPLRYRGYVYDQETGLYYLQSRYYNPVVGRFINADGLVATGQGLLGNNMFAYCGNNPVAYSDTSGTARNYCVNLTDSGRTSTKYKANYVLTAKYPSTEWYSADDSKKKQMLASYHNDLNKLLGMKTSLYFYDEEPTNGLISYGYCIFSTFSIYINEDYFHYADSYKLFKTVTHEVRHAYQYLSIAGLDIVGYPFPSSEDYLTLVEWDQNIRNYISPSDDFDAYYAQPIEVDARNFANQKE